MMFFDEYTLTKKLVKEPKFRRVAKKEPWNRMSSGLYNDGLITIFESDYDDSFLSSWSWLIGDNTILLGCTCWGDFFYADMSEGEFYIVLSDQCKKFQMGNSFSAVFDMNLADANFRKNILKPDDFLLFQKEVGKLEYGELYIKSNRFGDKEKRDLSLVLDILGQAGKQRNN